MEARKRYKIEYVIAFLLLFVFLFVSYKLGMAYDDMESANVTTDKFTSLFYYAGIRLSETTIDLVWSDNIRTAILWGAFAWLLTVLYYFNSLRKYIFGKEFGTAVWGKLRDIKHLFAKNIMNGEIRKAKQVRTPIGRIFAKRKIRKECKENAESILFLELKRLEEWKIQNIQASKGRRERKRIEREYVETKKRLRSKSKERFNELFTEAWTPKKLKAIYEAELKDIDEEYNKSISVVGEAQKRKKKAEAKARYKAQLKVFYHGKKRIEKIKKKYENADVHFTKTERISLYNYVLNNNSLIMGGAGSGKTRGFVMPSLLQAHSSFVITDPKGEILEKAGYFLEKIAGYKIRVLNLSDKKKSEGYNPFKYIHPDREGYEERVLTLIETIIVNTDGGEKKGSSEPFWDNAERLFLQAMFFFTCDGFVPEEQTMNTVLSLIAMLEIEEDQDNRDSDLDYFVDIFAEEHGEDHIGVQQYREFRSKTSGKTAKSIVISAVARLAPFRTPEVKRIMSYDNMQLDRVGEEKTAIFVVVPPTDDTFNFISGMMFSQLFIELEYCATVLHKHEGQRLPIPVRFILDEFATTAIIPRFPKILAYARSFGIGISPIIQSLEQLKKMYKDEWGVIIDNCNTILYLGSISHGDTLDYMSKLLGKGTFDKKTSGHTHGRNSSSSANYDVLGRDLMDASEIRRLEKNKCLLIISGKNPFYSEKYEYKEHPNYKYTSDYNKAYAYDYVPANPDDLSFEEDEGVGSDREKALLQSAKDYALGMLTEFDKSGDEIGLSLDRKATLQKIVADVGSYEPIRDELLYPDEGEEFTDEEILHSLGFESEDLLSENVFKGMISSAKEKANEVITAITEYEAEDAELITDPHEVARTVITAGENLAPIRDELLYPDEGEAETEDGFVFDERDGSDAEDVGDLGDILAELCGIFDEQEKILNN